MLCEILSDIRSVMGDERSSDVKIEKLNGRNFKSWKFQMKLVLMERDLYGFVDGSEIRPAMDAQEGVRRKYKMRENVFVLSPFIILLKKHNTNENP